MNLYRQFASPWPAVLVEMKDFVELSRLALGGGYRSLQVQVTITKDVTKESLTSPAVREFCDWLEKIPRCQKPVGGFFSAHDHANYRIDIEIER